MSPSKRERNRRHNRARRRQARGVTVSRFLIAARDGWRCGLCGEPITRTPDLTIDHIVPLCAGGTSHPNNLQAAHRVCNERKGNTLPVSATAEEVA